MSETIGDIIAEKRGYSAGMPPSYHVTMTWHDFRKMLDRLEAAWKREKAETEAARLGRAVPGHQDSDVAKLREALEKMSALFEKGVICISYADTQEGMEQLEELYRKIKVALAAPPRNGDVGTEEEQFERWQAFCDMHDKDCTGCPFKGSHTTAYCFAKWAQTPYEEGSSK